jgi:hypothetical protein
MIMPVTKQTILRDLRDSIVDIIENQGEGILDDDGVDMIVVGNMVDEIMEEVRVTIASLDHLRIQPLL